jgi:hypothetical protein
MARPSNAPTYEDDFVAWLEDQARYTRHGEIDALDLENIAEELEGIARSDRRDVRNRLTRLLTHLPKCWMRPQRRLVEWLGTTAQQRSQIAMLLEDSPSLRTYPTQTLDRCYPEARRKAVLQMRSRESVVHEPCPFSIEDVLDVGWLPAARAG